MSTTNAGFIVYERRGEKVYAYRKLNKRDPKTKKVKCVSKTYLGVYDSEADKVSKPRAEQVPRGVFSYGGVYLIEQILDSLGLKKILFNIYGGDYKQLRDLIIFKCLSTEPLYLFPYWRENHYLREASSLRNSASISKFISNLGEATERREIFFREWSKELNSESGVLFDLTSISTYCEENEYCEKGYNKDRDQTGQVNIGMIYSKGKQLPIAYRTYPGSLKDVSTIKNLVEMFQSLDLKILYLVLDRGFFSIPNLRHLVAKNTDFIVSIPQNRKVATELILSSTEEVVSPRNNFIYNGESVYCHQVSTKIAEVGVKLYLYCDERRQAEEKSSLMLALDSLEKDFLANSFENLEVAIEYAQDSFGSLFKCFNFSENKDKIFIDKNEIEINKLVAFKGKFILATNGNLNPQEALDMYRKKDQVEKVFDDLKNELKEKKFRSKKTNTFEGKMLLNFLCLIVISHMRNVMKSKDLYKELTLRTMLANLQKLKVFKLQNNKNILAEITAKQKKIYAAFGFEYPEIQ